MASDGLSQQERKNARIKREHQQDHKKHTQHMLSVLQVLPRLRTKNKFKQIRESISAIQSQQDFFPPTAGDSLPDALECSASDDDTPGSVSLNVTRGSHTTPSLTKDYVTYLANNQYVDDQSPIFQVISHKKNFEESISSQNGSSNSIHFTHLHMLDSSGDVMVGRLNMNLTHGGCKLQAGDIV
jgi:hypothetical protein